MKRILIIVALGIIRGSADAAPFQNLDLESVNTNAVAQSPERFPYLAGGGPIAELLPGWKLSLHKDPAFDDDFRFGLPFNFGCVEAECATLVSREARPYEPFIRYPAALESPGNYSLFMAIGIQEAGISYTLKQTGEVPADARMLDTEVTLLGFGVMDIRLNGELVQQKKGFNLLLNKDISAFAGKNVELELKFYSTEMFFVAAAGFHGIQFVTGPKITAIVQTQGEGTNQVSFFFVPMTGKNMIVESTDDFSGGADWQALAGAPHNSGSATDVSSNAQRFYRLRVTDP